MPTNSLVALALALGLLACPSPKGPYKCPPCEQSCDALTFEKAGTCPHCGMPLVPGRPTPEPAAEREVSLSALASHRGRGFFKVQGGPGHSDQALRVYFYVPKDFTPDSQVVLVIPGAGRNADRYRDTWIDAADRKHLLILSPEYPKSAYGFEDYHLCGVLSGSNLADTVVRRKGSNHAFLDEDRFRYDLVTQRERWIFGDFDRIVAIATRALRSRQKGYDVFGHSAGGHILHRLALFGGSSQAARILAANPSFYTLPDLRTRYPFGLAGTGLGKEDLRRAFARRLVVFLGEFDNASETGGTFLRSTSADKQGLHRLARGRFFFEQARATAARLGYDFNWQLHVVPKVGHDQSRMGRAAASYLFGHP